MKRNLSKILTVVFFMVNTTLLSCFGIGDCLLLYLQYERIESWNDLVGVYRNGYDRNEYLILHKDTTYTHIYEYQDSYVKSNGTVIFYLDSTGWSSIGYNNWEVYGNYTNQLQIGDRPETIINDATLRYVCSDNMQFDFGKLGRTEKYLNQFDCKIESAYRPGE